MKKSGLCPSWYGSSFRRAFPRAVGVTERTERRRSNKRHANISGLPLLAIRKDRRCEKHTSRKGATVDHVDVVPAIVACVH